MSSNSSKENVCPTHPRDSKKAALERSGPRKTVYWVEKKPVVAGETEIATAWCVGAKYKGEWKADKKHGFGILQYSNRAIYKGKFACGRREGEGALWTFCGGKLHRGYTGMWQGGDREGKGTSSYPDGGHYEGFWHKNHREGFGRMIYPSGEVYFGNWHSDLRSGYGIMVYKNGDNYEGMWLGDCKEGHGSYFYANKGSLLVGEWADNVPAAGVYADVDGRPSHGLPLPPLGLDSPLDVLEAAVEKVRCDRNMARARHLPVENLLEKDDIEQLKVVFDQMQGGIEGLGQALSSIFGEVDQACIVELCASLELKAESVTFDGFCRTVFALLQGQSSEN